MKTSNLRNKKKSKKNRNARDYSKYVFQGEQYGKGTLVRAVISKYAEDHPNITADKLKTIFPKKEIHSTFEVVEPVKKAAKGRFFLRPEHIIKVKDSKVAVTSQWSKNNIQSFIDFVKKNLHMKIQHRSYRLAA